VSRNILASASGVVNPAKIFLTSNLINMQNLVAVSPIVCAHVGGPKDLGERWDLAPWDGAWLTE